MQIAEDIKETYEREGFLTRLEVFSEADILHFRNCFDELEEREGRENCQIGIAGRHFEEEFIWQMATNRKLLDVAEQLMGEDILLLSTHFFCKYPDPKAEAFVAWHQDITYWGLEPPVAYTAWVAVDDSDAENGCMQVIPGSHRKGIVRHGKSGKEGNLLSINQEIPDEAVNESKAVNLELKAGQVSFHHGHLFHSSRQNRSTRRRCGLTVRLIPPEVKQTGDTSFKRDWSPVLVRGRDRLQNFPVRPAPFPILES